MDRLQNIPYYDFSWQNFYSPNYNIAYKRALNAQRKIIDAKRNPYSSAADIKKWEQDLMRWENKVKDYTVLAKREENRLEEQREGNGGITINYLA